MGRKSVRVCTLCFQFTVIPIYAQHLSKRAGATEQHCMKYGAHYKATLRYAKVKFRAVRHSKVNHCF